jgi:phage/plasmid-like protein (TIGR03299 family)
MSHNLNQQNGRYSFAFEGSVDNIWHRHGQQINQDMSDEQVLSLANLNYTTVKVPAYALMNGKFERIDNAHFVARGDTMQPLSERSCSDVYKPHQNLELLQTVRQYAEIDREHWKLSTLGSLGNGARVFFTAEYNGKRHEVGGDEFKFYLLASTTHDMSGASFYQGSTIRVVCNNTFSAATAMPQGLIKVRHSTNFNKDTASRQLAAIIQSFDRFKVVGDAMVQTHITREETKRFFRAMLDIDQNATKDDISTRKLNQYHALSDAYAATVAEGTERDRVWTVFNAVTRYVDHERQTRGGETEELARFASSQFGSGANLKTKAWDLLLPMIKDKVAA